MFNDTISVQGSGLIPKVSPYQLWTIELSACKGSEFMGRFIIKKSASNSDRFLIILVHPLVFMDSHRSLPEPEERHSVHSVMFYLK